MIAAGEALPDHIANAPDLPLDLILYYNAFVTLDTCRVNSMSVGQIPWTAIDQFCSRHQITGDMEEDMHYFIGELDATYRKYVDDNSDKGTK